MRLILLLALSMLAFAGEAPAVPSAIKPTLDSFEADATKAYAAYQAALSKAQDKAEKDMEAKLKSATKSGNLELANAINASLDKLNNGGLVRELETKWKAAEADAPATLLAVTDALTGKWGNGMAVMWDFKADGTGMHFWGGAMYPVTWVKGEKGYTVTLLGRAPRACIFVDKNSIQLEPGISVRMK